VPAATPPSLVLRQIQQRPLARLVPTLRAHVTLAVADPTIVPRQLAEVDRVRAAHGVLAVAAVTRQAVLEGDVTTRVSNTGSTGVHSKRLGCEQGMTHLGCR